MPKCILTEQQGSGGGGGSSVVLQSIAIKTAPTKTSYLAGDTFNASGMVVEATYVIGSVPIATTEVTGYTVSPTTLSDGVTSVTITYSEGGVTCTAQQAVTVTHKLTKIAVTTNPTKTSYEYGDTLATAGMVVTATYSDGKTAAVTGYSCSPTALNTVTNSQAITVSYAENGVTKTTTFNVVVNRKSVTKPTWKSNLTYNGSAQSVSGTGSWNNYNTTYMTIGGTTSSTNAGTYTATFTLKSNYRWADGTTTALDVNWTINKATGTLSLSPTTVAITASNYSAGVTVTASGSFDGTVSITPTSVTGLTLSVSGKTITVKGNGSTNVSSTTITVKVSAGTNYTAPANKTFTVSAQYWSFGAGTGETADAAWFAGLKNYLASNKGSTIKTTGGSSIVGATKSVTLSSAVQGATTHTIRVIGVDQDGSNTVTWQTVNCLPTTTTFGSSAQWDPGTDSTAKTICTSYYNAFPGKASIKTVSKGTNTAYNSSSVAYTDETVFLPSIHEMGLASYQYAPTTGEYTNGCSAAYSYYSSNANRVKNQSDSTATAAWYWTRSRYTDGSYGVCLVNYGGSATNTGYDITSGRVAPAFVIG